MLERRYVENYVGSVCLKSIIFNIQTAMFEITFAKITIKIFGNSHSRNAHQTKLIFNAKKSQKTLLFLGI
jgi:hypothetical protein